MRHAVTDTAHDAELVGRFRDAAVQLHRDGADIITTSCGFLSPLQAALEDAVPVPVVTSVLIDLPDIRHLVGHGSAIGILTFDSRKLGTMHLPSATGPFAVSGLEDGYELYRVISNDHDHLDRHRAAEDALTSAKRFLGHSPDVSVIVLECTNLPPYQSDIENETGIPTYSIHEAIAKRI